MDKQGHSVTVGSFFVKICTATLHGRAIWTDNLVFSVHTLIWCIRNRGDVSEHGLLYADIMLWPVLMAQMDGRIFVRASSAPTNIAANWETRTKPTWRPSAPAFQAIAHCSLLTTADKLDYFQGLIFFVCIVGAIACSLGRALCNFAFLWIPTLFSGPRRVLPWGLSVIDSHAREFAHSIAVSVPLNHKASGCCKLICPTASFDISRLSDCDVLLLWASLASNLWMIPDSESHVNVRASLSVGGFQDHVWIFVVHW